MQWRNILQILVVITMLAGFGVPAFAQEGSGDAEAIHSLTIAIDTLWVMVAAFLVFFMNLGFGMVESGLCRAKNTVNILAKNFIVFAIFGRRLKPNAGPIDFREMGPVSTFICRSTI
jgi:hypothetical protein